MISGGALLVALLLQTASGAPGTASETGTTRARLDLRGAAECISRSDLAGARRGPFRTHPVRRRCRGLRSRRRHLSASRERGRGACSRNAGRRAATPSVRRAVVRGGRRRDRAHHRSDPRSDVGAELRRPRERGCSDRAAVGRRDAACRQTPRSAAASPPAAPPATLEPATPAPPVASARKQRFGAYVAGQTIFGPAPSVMPGLALYAMAALDGEGVWSPALFLGATHVWRDDLSEPGGAASFTLDAASLDACPCRSAGRGSWRGRARPRSSGGWRRAAPIPNRRRARAAVRDRGRGFERQLRNDRRAVRPSRRRHDVDSRLLRLGGTTFHRAGADHHRGEPGRRSALALTPSGLRRGRQLRHPPSRAGCPDAPRRMRSASARASASRPSFISASIFMRGRFRTEAARRVLFLVAAQDLQRAPAGARGHRRPRGIDATRPGPAARRRPSMAWARWVGAVAPRRGLSDAPAAVGRTGCRRRRAPER